LGWLGGADRVDIDAFTEEWQGLSARALKELAASEAQLRSIFEQAAVGVALFESATDRFRRINQRYCGIVGYSVEEMRERNFMVLTHEQDLPAQVENMNRLVAGDIGEFSVEVRYYRKDRSLVWVNLTVSPTWRPGEKPECCIAVVEDITARKQAQQALLAAREELEEKVRERTEKLRQAERLAGIGEMFTGLAHESRNALQQSQACLDILSLKLGGVPEVDGLLADIQRSQDHIHQLYERVRNYAALIKLKREPVELTKLVDEAWEHLAALRKGRSVRLQHEPPGGTWMAAVDRLALGQVLRNVLENALQACPDPVEVNVTWSRVEHNGRPAVQIALRDNGPPLPPDVRRRLFQPFFTTRRRGTGLGLAIARRLVEAHDGTMTLGPAPQTEIVIIVPEG
jgi:PAS domain S-box-containing protein